MIFWSIKFMIFLVQSKFGRILRSIFQKSHLEYDFVTSVYLVYHINIRNIQMYDQLHLCNLLISVIELVNYLFNERGCIEVF